MQKLLSERVDDGFFRSNPDILELLSGLRGIFQITWANERVSHGTKMLCVILKPSEDIKQTFGFEREIGFFNFAI